MNLEEKADIIRRIYEDPCYIDNGKILFSWDGVVYEIEITPTNLPDDYNRRTSLDSSDNRTIWL